MARRPCSLKHDYMTFLQVKGALLTWLQRDCSDLKSGLPPFLRNKLSQTLVSVLQVCYCVGVMQLCCWCWWCMVGDSTFIGFCPVDRARELTRNVSS